MVKQVLAATALAALAACGGGGGGSSFAPAASPAKQPAPIETPAVVAVKAQPTPINPGCVTVANRTSCDLIANDQPIGVGVPPGIYAVFTNRTGGYLQITEADAYTGERQFWSEYCVYVGDFVTGQHSAGVGEVGCAAKNVGEDYVPIHWGAGLSVAPGQSVYIGSHTEPQGINHTYSLKVTANAAGMQSWRMPQHDAVIPCDGQTQSTAGGRWTNTSSKDRQLVGASIYSESGRSTNTVSGAACIYVFAADGSTKYQNCDDALRTRGDVSFPAVSIAPGESVAAQALNTCASPGVWDWAAFLRVTGDQS